MKKIILGMILALGISVGAKADGLMLNGVVTTGASDPVITQNWVDIDAQIWSAAGSVATVVIECKSYTSAPWYPCWTVTNPTATGVYYSLPRAAQYRLNVSAWTSGTIYGTIIVYQRP